MDGAEAVGLIGTAEAGAIAVGGAIVAFLGIVLAWRVARRAFS